MGSSDPVLYDNTLWFLVIWAVFIYIQLYCIPCVFSIYKVFTIHQLLQCVTWVVFVYRFHFASTTTVCPLGGLCIQVLLYINYYSVPWVAFIYRFHCTSTTVQCISSLGGLCIQVLRYINYSIPWVIFYKFHCTSTTVCPLGGLYIQVPLYISYYSVSLGWPLHTGSTEHQPLQLSFGWSLYTGTMSNLLKTTRSILSISSSIMDITTFISPADNCTLKPSVQAGFGHGYSNSQL